MPLPIGTTFWRCPSCEHFLQIDGTELAQIGVPFCDQCETEMEPQDDPVPTVLLIEGEYLGIALRPKEISFQKFEKMIVSLWKEWDKSESEKHFAEWIEEHDTPVLDSKSILVPRVK